MHHWWRVRSFLSRNSLAKLQVQLCHPEGSQPVSGQDTIRRTRGKKQWARPSSGGLAVAVGLRPALSCRRRATGSQRRRSCAPASSKIRRQGGQIPSWPAASSEAAPWPRSRSSTKPCSFSTELIQFSYHVKLLAIYSARSSSIKIYKNQPIFIKSADFYKSRDFYKNRLIFIKIELIFIKIRRAGTACRVYWFL